jgi:hypothetical protein
MKLIYYVSRKERLNGEHLVHSQYCPFLAGRKDMILLGRFSSVSEALSSGTSRFSKVGKCPFCSGYHMSDTACTDVRKINKSIPVTPVRDANDYDFMVCCLN